MMRRDRKQIPLTLFGSRVYGKSGHHALVFSYDELSRLGLLGHTHGKLERVSFPHRDSYRYIVIHRHRGGYVVMIGCDRVRNACSRLGPELGVRLRVGETRFYRVHPGA